MLYLFPEDINKLRKVVLMEQLAERYAELKGTAVIASNITGNSITFVLESGPKLTMSTRQLEEAIAEMEKANSLTLTITTAEAEPEAPVRIKKGKGKK